VNRTSTHPFFVVLGHAYYVVFSPSLDKWSQFTIYQPRSFVMFALVMLLVYVGMRYVMVMRC